MQTKLSYLTPSSFNWQGHADAEDYTESDDEGADGYRHWDYLQALSLFLFNPVFFVRFCHGGCSHILEVWWLPELVVDFHQHMP